MSRPALGLALPLATRGRDAQRFVGELVEEVVAADAAGFDLCLVPEHHEARPASIVAPLTLCAALLARTTRIRVGTGILILPCHHPRHVAEQATLLDQLSGGRLVLGVGAGYQPEDLEPFGVSMAERGSRFEQALAELGTLLSEDGGLQPPPVQRPRPPLWVGSWAPAGIRRAAALADGWIADPIRTTDEIAAMAARYREASAARPGTVVVMREAWVDAEPGARGRFEPVIAPVFDYYRRKGAAEIPATFDEFVEDRFVIGAPEDCVAQVEELAARTGAAVVALTIRHPGGPDHETVLDAIGALGAAWSRQPVEAAG